MCGTICASKTGMMLVALFWRKMKITKIYRKHIHHYFAKIKADFAT
jgi:hypothetical protein